MNRRTPHCGWPVLKTDCTRCCRRQIDVPASDPRTAFWLDLRTALSTLIFLFTGGAGLSTPLRGQRPAKGQGHSKTLVERKASSRVSRERLVSHELSHV
jgi:hypothetical protein